MWFDGVIAANTSIADEARRATHHSAKRSREGAPR